MILLQPKKKCKNINYNDLLKQLMLSELRTVLDNLEERQYNEDFYAIWNCVLGISKEEFDDMSKELSFYIDDYFHKYKYQRYHHFLDKDRSVCAGNKYRTLYKPMHDIGETLSCTDIENTLNFYNLVKYGASINEMKKFICSFIKYYDKLKNDLLNEHKNIFTERMKNSQRLDI